MNPKRWQQIEQLYHSAMERDAAQRTAYLNEVCVNDQELRGAVVALLSADKKAENFLSTPAFELAVKEQAEALAREPSLLITGQALNHYRVISRLGAGGMGEVWLAEDISLRRRVALKLLRAQFTTHEDRVRRFEQEARAASALNHPNIITVHEIGKSEAMHYLVTEFVDGQTLREHESNNELPLAQALDIAVQIAAALAAAHESGIIHRDIKPENVMIRPDGYVKVLDFGLAKLTERKGGAKIERRGEDDPTLAQSLSTETGTVMGTASYMSPEQARGLKVDARTDVFSLGILLYEMIAGNRPFTGETTMDVLSAILSREPAPLTTNKETVPDELQRIVSKMLRKAPDERYQTGRDLWGDLKSLKQEIEFQQKLGQSQPSASQNPNVTNGSTTGSFESIKSTIENPTAQATRDHDSIKLIFREINRHRMGVTAIMALLVVALAAGGYGIYHKLNSQQQTFQNIKLDRLTSAGNSFLDGAAPAISPNGQYAAYVNVEGSLESLWVKQIATGSVVQIAAPAEVVYYGQTFSPDNNYIYYAVGDGKTGSALYKIPSLGGPSSKILADVKTAITFSPKGDKFAYAAEHYTALNIADVQTNTAQTIAKRQGEGSFTRVSWSPDEQTIACIKSSVKNGGELLAIRVADGSTQAIGTTQWGSITGLAWLPQGKGIVISAAEKGSRNYQLWAITFPAGEATRMTNDLSNYHGISTSSDGTRMVSSRHDRSVNLWVTAIGDTTSAHQVNPENGADDGMEGLAWTPDRKIVYSARNHNDSDLWIVDANGSDRKQLTSNAGRNYFPAISGDGRSIIFISNRSQKNFSLWSMDIDGGNPRQLTDDSGLALKPECSLDGRIVYEFERDKQTNLWQTSLDGKAPLQLTTTTAQLPTISPDGKLIACNYGNGTPESPLRLALLPSTGGEPLQQFNFQAVIKSPLFRWLPDNSGLAYLDVQDKVFNVFSQALTGGQPKPLTNFKSDRIYYFALSRDGKQIACARGRETADLVLVNNLP